MTKNLFWIGFFQATALVIYCALIALFIWNANQIFGKITDFRGPLLFLLIFVTSALISGVLTLGYPFLLWQKKESQKALKLVFYTAGFLVVYAILTVFLLLLKF
ncbi:MAG: hypothetical protein M1365_00815 [Actinobacteria bacterium]|nr:hypothetical protein [Actinomycetota bacterium]